MSKRNLFQACLLGLLFFVSAVAQAQFTFTTNNEAITITGYNTAAGLNVVIPAATNGYPVISIGDEALFGSSITNVIIPNSVTNLGNYALDDCTSLTNIAVDASNPAYSSLGGVLFDKAGATLIQFPAGLGGNYLVSNSVTTIGADAFGHCTSLANVTIPNSVTNLGVEAFYKCTSRFSVTIGNGVTSIGEDTFFDCTNLLSVTIPTNVTSIGNSAFDECISLTNVTIPKNVTNIGKDAFYQCTSLKNVTIPSRVTSLGGEAFAFCTGLTNLTIPNSITNVAEQTFAGCTGLTSVTIPNSVTSIGEAAFALCLGLMSVTIPNSITNLADGAFANCSNLTSAYFQGNEPFDGGFVFDNNPATVYYLYGTTGWGPTFGGVPTELWNPQSHALSFTGGHFGFNLTGPTNAVIVVEACTNLSDPVWLPVTTNTFSTIGTSTFSDLQSGAHPTRFYRERSP